MEKAPGAFRTISEVADDVDVPQHVLRFWESRFTQIRPMKRGGGRRFYRPEDVDLLRGVRHLLYGEGYTIRGVQRILREQGSSFVQSIWRTGAEAPPPMDEDRDDDDIAAAPPPARLEPDLSTIATPAPRAHQTTVEDPGNVGREAVITPSPAEIPRKAAGLGGEERLTLRAALAELVACDRLLQAVRAAEQDTGDRPSTAPGAST